MTDDDRLPEGVYRDGRSIVVDLRGSRFPFRCVKTNRPVRYHSSHLVREYNIVAYTLWAAISIYGRRLTRIYDIHGNYLSVVVTLLAYWLVVCVLRRSRILWIGLDEEYAERRKRRARIGWRMIVGGLIGLVVAGAIQVAALLGGLLLSPDSLVNFVPEAFALLALCGLPVLIVASLPLLWRRKKRGHFLWLGGANRDFLASLPAWQAARTAQRDPGETPDG